MIENDDAMELLSPSAWVERAKSISVSKRRKVVIDYWVKANGFKDAEEGVNIVRHNNGLYASFDKAVKAIIDVNSAFSTIETYRKNYRLFIDSCIKRVDNRAFERIVRQAPEPTNNVPENYYPKERYCPTIDQFRDLLIQGNIRQKAFLSMAACLGSRVEEILSRKRSDIEFDYKLPTGHVIPGRVRLEAGATKKKYLRYGFLSHEAVKLLRTYWNTVRPSQWVFPSVWTKKTDTHVHQTSMRRELEPLYKKVGIQVRVDQMLGPHSFRSFCEQVMRKAAFNDTLGKIIVGHRDLETKAYKGNWDEIAASWLERVEKPMNFLAGELVTENFREVKEENKELRERLENTEKKVDRLLRVLRDKLPDTQPRQLVSQELLEILRAKEGLPGLTLEEAVKIVLAKERKTLPPTVEMPSDGRTATESGN